MFNAHLKVSASKFCYNDDCLNCFSVTIKQGPPTSSLRIFQCKLNNLKYTNSYCILPELNPGCRSATLYNIVLLIAPLFGASLRSVQINRVNNSRR